MTGLEDWFITTIVTGTSLLAVWSVKSCLVQSCMRFDLVQIKKFMTETKIVRLQTGYCNIFVKPFALFKASFQISPCPLQESNYSFEFHPLFAFFCCTEINIEQCLFPFL